jgi:hypothetical protein
VVLPMPSVPADMSACNQSGDEPPHHGSIPAVKAGITSLAWRSGTSERGRVSP